MKHMTLIEIAAACKGQLFCSTENQKEVTSVVIDSRLVSEGSLFIATPGERVDGHSFINSAFEKGALAVLCEKEPQNSKGPYILVKNSFQALKDIAKWYRSNLRIKVVGVTGSVGKTSTKEFISSVLSEKYQVLKTEGNYNNEVGLPLTILKIRDEHEIAVLEMGISDFGEMHRLADIARPDIAVITNIGPCHLENLGTLEGVLKAKSEIFDFLKEDGKIVVNGDDKLLATLEDVKGITPYKISLHNNKMNVYSSNLISKGLLGSTCLIHYKEDVLNVHIPLPGEHMVLNALTATMVGYLLGLSKEEIIKGIQAVRPVNGRSNVIAHGSLTIIDDCYNANPISMKAAIDLLSLDDTGNKKVAILGDMFELGDNQEQLHHEVGAYAANRNLDMLLCVGALSSHMYDGANTVLEQKENISSTKLLYFESREELIHSLPQIIKENSTILVKASHGMGFSEVVKTLNSLSLG